MLLSLSWMYLFGFGSIEDLGRLGYVRRHWAWVSVFLSLFLSWAMARFWTKGRSFRYSSRKIYQHHLHNLLLTPILA